MWFFPLFCVLLDLISKCNAFTFAVNPVSSAGFLADEIPLEVVTVIPVSLKTEREVFVHGKQALTVVFTRPVIALGSDFGFKELPLEMVPFSLDPPVHGRGRWVTTFIYRFDPDAAYATDLRTKFIWNRNLRTYDGVLLKLDHQLDPTLRTKSLTMSLVAVKSERAQNVTGGLWNPFTGLSDDILPEVPPDGLIRLRFNARVSLKILQESLRVVIGKERKKANVQVAVKPCSDTKPPVGGEAEYACASPIGDLEIGIHYSFLLEKGIDYGRDSGPLNENLTASFGGLRRFRIPFVTSDCYVHTQALKLFLPHGLAEGTDINDIGITLEKTGKKQIKFKFMRLGRAELQMIAYLIPELGYKISVQSSKKVRDAFGLSLEASSIEFKAAKVSSDFERLNPGSISNIGVFESSQDWSREMLAVSKGAMDTYDFDYTIKLWSVAKATSVVRLHAGWRNPSFNSVLGPPDDLLIFNVTDPVADLSTKNLTHLLTPTGIVACENIKWSSFVSAVFVETTVQVAAITFNQFMSRQTVAVWVTSMETGKPVVNAAVHIYGATWKYETVTQLGNSTTDSDGIARINDVRSMDRLTAVIRMGSKLMYLQNLSMSKVSSMRFLDALVVDRVLVRPGEALHVKGYVKKRKLRELLSATEIESSSLTISPALSGNGSVSISVDKKFGSYEAIILVPEDATLSTYKLGLVCRARGLYGDSFAYFGKSQTFTVAVPRLPTVELTVDTPYWIRPTDVIKITVNIESLIGSAVGGSEITVKWKVGSHDSGELTITTDDSGTGMGDLDLSTLETPPKIGSKVELEFQYIGPTSELIEESATVRIEAADIDLHLDRTVNTNIPGQSFGVSVSVSDLRGSPLTGHDQIRSTTLSMLKLAKNNTDKTTTGTEPLKGKIVRVCKYVFGKTKFCRFKLLKMGKFAVETCVVRNGHMVCERFFIGRDAGDWKYRPLKSFIPIGFFDLTPKTVLIGDAKKILVDNIYNDAYAFVSWGTPEEAKEKVIAVPKGRSTIKVGVDDLCIYNCGLTIIVAVPRQTKGLAANVHVPVSKLFDPAMPHSQTYDGQIDGKPTTPTSIDVSMSFPDADVDGDDTIVRPGETTSIEVKVDSMQRTQVTLIGVDKSLLEAMPYTLPNLSPAFNLDLAIKFNVAKSSDFILAPQLIRELIKYNRQRKSVSPWFSLASSDRHNRLVDQSVQESVLQSSCFITIHSSRSDFCCDDSYRSYGRPEYVGERGTVRWGGGGAGYGSMYHSARISFGQRAAGAAFSVKRAEAKLVPASLPVSSPTAPTVLGRVRLESEFEATPLFETEVTSDGVLRANFTAPPNLGTFVIRAYVTSKDGIFGSTESEIIVRRDISLTASIPRFVRDGDRFEAGAVVTVSGTPTAPVTMKMKVKGPLKIIGKRSITVRVGADGQEEARLKLCALAVGVANITLVANDDYGNCDVLKVKLKIEGRQESVTVGTSFSIEGADQQSWVEGINLPDAVPGSGDVLITAGVGKEPAVMSLAAEILHWSEPFECPISGDFALASAAIPGILNPYNPWSIDAESHYEYLTDLIDLVLKDFERAVTLISISGPLTTKYDGLKCYLECPDVRYRCYYKFYQNAKGVFIIDMVKQQLLNHTKAEVRAKAGTIIDAAAHWKTVMKNVLVEEAQTARCGYPHQAIWIFKVAFGRAILGADWIPPVSDRTIIDDLSMKRLGHEFDAMSLDSQAYYILTLLATPQGAQHSDVEKAMRSWTNRLRITARTAYIAAYDGGTEPASTLGNVLAFLAMIRYGQHDQLIPRMGNYIANPPRDMYGFCRFGIYSKLVSMLALTEFDVSRGSAQPDLKLTAVSGHKTILSAKFTNTSAPVATDRVLWENLPRNPKPIQISATGRGEASVAITLNFVPIKLLPFPSYRGIFVERSIQLEDVDSGDGRSLSRVPRSSMVSVKVQFITPDHLGETIVRVLMPAGLEPVDPNVSGDDKFCPVPLFSLYRFWFYGQCPEQKTRPSVVTFKFHSVRSGTTSVSFRAVAATTGVYALPPTRVSVVEQPEVMGLSKAGKFNVCNGHGCTAQYEEPAATPINCPKDCSGNGVCNVHLGNCRCFPGFTGKACEIIAAPQ